MSWADKFLADCKRQALSSRTVEMYADRIRLLQTVHGLDFQTCTKDDVDQVIDALLKKSTAYAAGCVGMIKRGLVYLGREELAKQIKPIKIKDPEKKIREKILSPEEVKRLIKGAESLQDRLMIEIFTETGCRLGELYNLRIKDCQFDEDSGILSLTGKSGTRTNRVFYSVPDLRQQLNNHPARDDPNARLFHFGFHDSTKFNLNTVYHRVRSLGLKVLKKPIHPHMFRHTHATENTRLYNDRENMMLFGWNSPSMIKVYSHLTMKDVDEKVLVLHGRKRKEEVLRPIVSVQRCSSCQAENAPIAVYCHKCGQILASVTDEKIKEQMQKQAERVKEFEILAAKQAEDMQLLKAQIEEMDHKVTNAIVIASTEGEVFSGMLEKGYDQYLKEHPAMRRFFELDPKRAEDISHWITFEQTFMEEAKKNPKLSHKKLYKLVQKTMVERGKAKEDLSKTVA